MDRVHARVGRVPAIRTGLVLGAADDRCEREADQVALRAERPGTQPVPGAAESGQVRRATAGRPGHAAAGDAIDAGVQHAINVARGGGRPLVPRVRGELEQTLGADFGDVRVHTDARADWLNRHLQARAFTTDTDIFFRRGEYAPASRAGRTLLLHELTHVAQQDRNPAAGGVIQRAAVNSKRGRWVAKPYRAVSMSPAIEAGNVGADIDLRFMPNEAFPQSEQIGLIQVVTSMHDGHAVMLAHNPSVATGQYRGARIDTSESAQSPLYFENADIFDTAYVMREEPDALTADERQELTSRSRIHKLKDIPQHRPSGRYGSVKGTTRRSTRLHDEPRIGAQVEDQVSMRFETAVVVLRGRRKGSYQGSVSWGWSKQAGKRKVKLDPLAVVTHSAPSKRFKAAAKAWNKKKTSNVGTKRLKVPR
jgi:hypothetical protein